MELHLNEQERKLFLSKFKSTVYQSYYWDRLINKLKKKSKDEIIEVIDKTLRKSFKGRLPYPQQCCDFASDFGFIIFKDLGYNVKIFQNFNNGEHNFLLVDDEGIDFTSKQFDKSLPIRNIDLNNKYYINSKEHSYRTKVLNEVNYEWFAEQSRHQTLTGVLNYIPFSYIIKMVLKIK
jgi:hypothetical protein